MEHVIRVAKLIFYPYRGLAAILLKGLPPISLLHSRESTRTRDSRDSDFTRAIE